MKVKGTIIQLQNENRNEMKSTQKNQKDQKELWIYKIILEKNAQTLSFFLFLTRYKYRHD